MKEARSTLVIALPPGWVLAPLRDLGTWQGGGTPAKGNDSFWRGGEIPWVSPKDMKAPRIVDSTDHITPEAVAGSAVKLLDSNAVLVVTRSGILVHTLPVAVTSVPVTVNQDLKALVPYPGVDPDYVAGALRSAGHDILDTCAKDGVTVASIEFPRFLRHKIPIAPTEEQRRIVEALDSYLSRLDAAEAALQRVEANLERYRASVLQAAVEGRLVSTEAELAREEGRDYEPASVLLERILVERRQRWEEAELAKMRAKGKEPKGDTWKAKYKEPVEPNANQLPKLPDGWCWATIYSISVLVQYGTSAKTGAEDREAIPVLRMGNIVKGALRTDDLKYLPHDHPEFPKLLLKKGDLLFNRTNSPELVGKSAVYRGTPDPCSFASYLIRTRFASTIAPEFVAAAINSPRGREWVASVRTQQVGQANVNGTKLRSHALPLPPRAEQVRIVEELDRIMSIVESTSEVARTRAQAVSALRQAILRWAFEGKLVDQDPHDEPASALLERIRSERTPVAGQANVQPPAGTSTRRREKRGTPTSPSSERRT